MTFVEYLLPHFIFQQLDATLKLKQKLSKWLGLQTVNGIFEVLDYDSTLELHDAQGSSATFHRRMKVKYLQDHVIAFQDYAWGDGEVLAEYKISQGKVVDIYREGDRWNILVSLRETKKRNDVQEFHIERTVRNGFTQATEWRQTEIWLNFKRIRMAVVFPVDRPCKRATLVERGKNKTTTLGSDHFEILPDGRQILTWESKNPRRAEIYTLRWEW